MSHESTMPILRGDREDSLPLRTGRRIPRVGEKMMKEGDDFWRRFSMVVKEQKTKPVAEKKRFASNLTFGFTFDLSALLQ